MRTPTEEYWLAKEAAGEHIPVRLRTGIKPGYPQVPGRAMFSQGSLWYGFDPRGNPDLLVTAKEMPIATRKAGIMSDKASLKKLESQGSRRVTDDNIYGQGPHNTQNTSAYTWEPGYGYRQVSEQPPTYNHPGAFLGNTVRGGITVNGEGVLRKPYSTPQTINEGTVAPGLVNDQPIIAGGRNITVNGEVMNNALPEEFAQRGWEAKKPITVNGKETLQVWHPEYGYTSLEEATGEVGRGNYANLVTNEALDAYNPAIRADASNGTFLDQLRSIARKIDRGKETPADIKNTTEYEYPRIWDLILKTSLGKQEYPNGATMVSRGLWPGSSTTAKSPNYDALFTGYNRDMAMPYVRIGQNLGGKNNFGLPQYEKYFSKEKVELLRNIDRQIEELITTKGYYNQEDSGLLQHLHNLRSTLLGDKLPEFGGLQQLLVPNKANGEMLNTVMPRGLAMEHSTFGDLGAGNPIYISRLAGDTGFYDANAVSGALASEGPANNIYGVWLHSRSPEFTGIHDKGVGSTLIWNQDGFAPFLKSVHGNSIKNLSGSIESAYKKGGKFLKNNK